MEIDANALRAISAEKKRATVLSTVARSNCKVSRNESVGGQRRFVRGRMIFDAHFTRRAFGRATQFGG